MLGKECDQYCIVRHTSDSSVITNGDIIFKSVLAECSDNM